MAKARQECPNCFSCDIDTNEATGETVCRTCACLFEENCIVSSIEFSESGGGAASVVGQYVSQNATRPTSSSAGKGRGRYGSTRDSRDSTLARGKTNISRIANMLNIQKHVDRAYGIFNQAVSQNLCQGRKSNNIAAACLYMAARQCNVAIMLVDFSDKLRVNVFELGKTFLRLHRKFHFDKVLPLIDPCLFIQRYAAKLNLGSQLNAVTLLAMNISKQMDRDWIVAGRRPAGICAVALQVASNAYGIPNSSDFVRKLMRVSQSTVTKRMKEFEQTPSSLLNPAELAQQLDEQPTIDKVHGAHPNAREVDPPSFIQHRIADGSLAKSLADSGVVVPDPASKSAALQEESEDSDSDRVGYTRRKATSKGKGKEKAPVESSQSQSTEGGHRVSARSAALAARKRLKDNALDASDSDSSDSSDQMSDAGEEEDGVDTLTSIKMFTKKRKPVSKGEREEEMQEASSESNDDSDSHKGGRKNKRTASGDVEEQEGGKKKKRKKKRDRKEPTPPPVFEDIDPRNDVECRTHMLERALAHASKGRVGAKKSAEVAAASKLYEELEQTLGDELKDRELLSAPEALSAVLMSAESSDEEGEGEDEQRAEQEAAAAVAAAAAEMARLAKEKERSRKGRGRKPFMGMGIGVTEEIEAEMDADGNIMPPPAPVILQTTTPAPPIVETSSASTEASTAPSNDFSKPKQYEENLEDTFSDIDGDDFMKNEILPPAERQKKARRWEANNRDFLQKQEEKEKSKAADGSKEGTGKRKGMAKRPYKKCESGVTPLDGVRSMLETRRLSSKIDYSAAQSMFGKDGGFATPSAVKQAEREEEQDSRNEDAFIQTMQLLETVTETASTAKAKAKRGKSQVFLPRGSISQSATHPVVTAKRPAAVVPVVEVDKSAAVVEAEISASVAEADEEDYEEEFDEEHDDGGIGYGGDEDEYEQEEV